ncbi:MAG: hypothetical protein JSV49_11985 [Thermoplasmata archaeon]|nr:MAG: hypothetical protein JSV49_11985 [Thermoplasmata archaeon]
MKTIFRLGFIIITVIIFNYSFFDSLLYAGGTNEKIPLINFKEGHDQLRANAEPGENNSVYFPCLINGTYFNNKNITKIECNLDAEVTLEYYEGCDHKPEINQNWSIKVVPDLIELEPIEQKEFFVIVNVPAGMSYWVHGNVTVFGTVETFPDNKKYDIRNITGVVWILQYLGHWNVSSVCTAQSINKGDAAVFKVKVINSGNGIEPFGFYIENFKMLHEKGFEIQLETYHIEIDEKESEEVEIIVKTSRDTPCGNYEIDLRIGNYESIQISEIENHSKHIILTLNVKPDFADKYFFPSMFILIIIVTLVSVKIFLMIKKRKK